MTPTVPDRPADSLSAVSNARAGHANTGPVARRLGGSPTSPSSSIATCITDPPYNYEFIGKDWDTAEIARRLERIRADGNSKTLVKNIPYGSGLAGGVRNDRWYA
jgi:hypothetical protein